VPVLPPRRIIRRKPDAWRKGPSYRPFLPASLMYFCSGKPMHYFSGFDMATCLELARFLELASCLEMCPASVAPVVARLEKMRSPNFILPSVITSLRQVRPVWGGHPAHPQCGAMLAETLTAGRDDQIGEKRDLAGGPSWNIGCQYQRLRSKRKPTHRKVILESFDLYFPISVHTA
jgi:hypothetical protein